MGAVSRRTTILLRQDRRPVYLFPTTELGPMSSSCIEEVSRRAVRSARSWLVSNSLAIRRPRSGRPTSDCKGRT